MLPRFDRLHVFLIPFELLVFHLTIENGHGD